MLHSNHRHQEYGLLLCHESHYFCLFTVAISHIAVAYLFYPIAFHVLLLIFVRPWYCIIARQDQTHQCIYIQGNGIQLTCSINTSADMNYVVLTGGKQGWYQKTHPLPNTTRHSAAGHLPRVSKHKAKNGWQANQPHPAALAIPSRVITLPDGVIKILFFTFYYFTPLPPNRQDSATKKNINRGFWVSLNDKRCLLPVMRWFFAWGSVLPLFSVSHEVL